MMVVNIRLEPRSWRELVAAKRPEDLVVVEDGELTVAAIPVGTESGKPAVAFVFTLPDGRTVVAQTTLRLFQTAAHAFRGRYGA